MKRLYPNIYEFIWLLIYRHCIKLFCISRSPEAIGLSSTAWLEEMRFFAQDRLEHIKGNRCLFQLFKTYFSLISISHSIHRELKFQSAKHKSKKMSPSLSFGRFGLIIFLVVHTFISFALTYVYQIVNGGFNYGASLIAALSYIAIAWCIFEARALPLLKTTLIALITLTTFNSFFWTFWQNHIGKTCYSELCTLVDPNSIFQITSLKIILITFWFLFLLLLSFKNPIKRYLIFRQSTNRRL